MNSLYKFLPCTLISALCLTLSLSAEAAGRGGGGGGSVGGLASRSSMSSAEGEGFAIDLDGFRDGRTASQPGQNPSTLSFFDVKLGYLLSSGLYFGGIYTSMSNTPGFGGGTTVDTMTGYGATAGFHKAGFVFDVSYYISSTYTLPGNVTYTQGTSTLAYLGYKMMIGNGFNIGFGYAYYSLGYTQQTTNGVSTAQNTTLTYDHPCLSMGFQF